MDLRETREIKQRLRGARMRGGWHRVLFLMMIAVALAGIADSKNPATTTTALATTAK